MEIEGNASENTQWQTYTHGRHREYIGITVWLEMHHCDSCSLCISLGHFPRHQQHSSVIHLKQRPSSSQKPALQRSGFKTKHLAKCELKGKASLRVALSPLLLKSFTDSFPQTF